MADQTADYTANVMLYALSVVLLILCLYVIVTAQSENRKILQLPFCFAMTVVIFIVPQLLALVRYSYSEQAGKHLGEFAILQYRSAYPSETTIFLLILLCIAALLCVILGDKFPLTAIRIIFTRYSTRSQSFLYYSGVLLSVVALLANILIWQTARGNLHFYGQPELIRNLMYPGLLLLLYTYLRGNKKYAVFWLVFAAITPFSLIVLFAKREVAVRLVFSLLLGLFFWRRRILPLKSLLGVFLVLFLFLNLSGVYRECLTKKKCSPEISQIMATVVGPFNSKGHSELREAGHLIEYLQNGGAYQWGRGYLDQAVYSLLPARLIGVELKNKLLSENFLLTLKNYRKWSPTATHGVAWSGIGDSYLQFSYAGILVFFLIASLMRGLWIAATRDDLLFAQLLYILMLPTCLRALMHGTYVFTTELIYFVFVLGLIYLASRSVERKKSKKRRYN